VWIITKRDPTSKTTLWLAPIGLNFQNKQRRTVVRNLTDACADAIVGETSPEELHQALLRAANEAGISALSLVQDVMLRDKWVEPPQSLHGQ
jgi:hypothetical protein